MTFGILSKVEDVMANKRGTGLMAVWIDMPTDMEDEFNKWYVEEHLADVLSLPGVLSAARYEAVRSGPKHLAVYELESTQVVESEAMKNRQHTPWTLRMYPPANAANFIQNVYEMIYPDKLTDETANADFAPVLQIGRMAISPQNEEEWNQWYSGVFVPNFEKVDGCIRGRRWRAYRGTPKYSVMYELEDENVSQTPEWLKQRDIHPDNAKMRQIMAHANGSPGVWKLTMKLSK
jgi:hypothetical protein